MTRAIILAALLALGSGRVPYRGSAPPSGQLVVAVQATLPVGAITAIRYNGSNYDLTASLPVGTTQELFCARAMAGPWFGGYTQVVVGPVPVKLVLTDKPNTEPQEFYKLREIP